MRMKLKLTYWFLVLPEEIYPLDIKFSEVDYRDVGFVGNYYQSFPGMQFEKVME